MLRNYAAQNTETLPDLLVRKSPPKKEKQKKCRSPQIHGQLNKKICRDHALNKKFPTQKSSEIPLLHASQDSSQPIYDAKQLTGFYKKRAPIERYFKTD